MFLLLKALLLLLASTGALGVSAAKKNPDDISTVVEEQNWFKAAEHLASLDEWCHNWEGIRGLRNVDLFSYSRRISSRFSLAGYRAINYDIRTTPAQDLLSQSGFHIALGMCMELHRHD